MIDIEFLDELASSAPAPGGGGAAAYGGALASALASMVGNLTVGKKKYADVEDAVRESLDRLSDLRIRLVGLIDGDARAFEPLAAAYRMPKGTPEEARAKEEALQAALGAACDVPLEIMACCVEVIGECDFMARNGSRLAVSDAGVGVAFAKAALLGASLNVYINASSMSDAERAARYRSKADALISQGVPQADAVYASVAQQVGARVS